MKKVLYIDPTHDSYSSDNMADRTMTVAEVIEKLENYDLDLPIVFWFDNGYTYGKLTEDKFFLSDELEED